jgi:succinyl-CoA synthetase alpha subunit
MEAISLREYRRKGGTKFKNIPVYNTIAESVEINEANVSLIFVPSIYACDAILESVFAGIKTIICITRESLFTT